MATKKVELVEIRPIELRTVTLRIVGDTPLIMHAWSAKAKRQILEKELGITKTKSREPKNPIEDFASSMYWLSPMPEEFTAEEMEKALSGGARFGFPVTAFKMSAISAAYRMGWVKDKMGLRGAFFLDQDADHYYGDELEVEWVGDKPKKIRTLVNVLKAEPMVEIFSDPPVMREDPVTVGNGGADLRYRGEFCNWYADIKIKYNVNGQYSLEQIVNIFNAGGFACGVGEWRPEKDGQYGMYHVEDVK